VATQPQLQAYTPSTPAATIVTMFLFMPRAVRWVARELTDVTAPVAADLTDAECAYTLHLAALETAASNAENIGSVKLDDRGTVTVDADSVKALQGTADRWLTTAYGHLLDAGLTWGYDEGVAR
jgi:hypothetical protein